MVSKSDVIAWADQEIDRRAEVPLWLIDLSMSNSPDLRRIDIVGLLRVIGGHGNEARVCNGIYSLMPDLGHCAYDDCEAIARKLYEITRSVLKMCIAEGDDGCLRGLRRLEIWVPIPRLTQEDASRLR